MADRALEVAAAARDDDLPNPSRTVRWERVGADGRVTASQLSAGRVGRAAGFQSFLTTLSPEAPARLSRVARWLDDAPPTVLVGRRTAGAFLVGVLDTEELRAEMTARSGVLVDRHLYAVDGAGHLLFYSDAELFRRGVDLTRNPPIRLHLSGRQGPVRFASVVSGKPRLGFVARLATIDWAVIVTADIGAKLIGLRRQYVALGWAILFSLTAALAILLWTSRRLAGPLLQIRDALRDHSRLRGGPLQVPGSVRDVAEYRELVEAIDALSARLRATERELVQAEKSALLGQLASGIAHEIGTPLNVMSGNAQYVLRKQPELSDPARSALSQIVKQAERVTEMIRQLLDFARVAEPRQVPFDMGGLIDEVLAMLPSISRKVEVRVDVDPDTPPAFGDPRLVEHAILNLVVNACQAMPDGGKLSIVVGLGTAPDDDRSSKELWICCKVVDTGCGIPQEDLRRIFEPFYSTKAQGQGTGLGLAIVERIVNQHQGRIAVSSRPGAGSVFTLCLRPADEK